MNYDFDKIFERRNTGSEKWDGNKDIFSREDLLPMWVADMDFSSPMPVIEAIKKRAEHGIFGYAMPTKSCYEAVIEKVERSYNWKIKKMDCILRWCSAIIVCFCKSLPQNLRGLTCFGLI